MSTATILPFRTHPVPTIPALDGCSDRQWIDRAGRAHVIVSMRDRHVINCTHVLLKMARWQIRQRGYRMTNAAILSVAQSHPSFRALVREVRQRDLGALPYYIYGALPRADAVTFERVRDQRVRDQRARDQHNERERSDASARVLPFRPRARAHGHDDDTKRTRSGSGSGS